MKTKTFGPFTFKIDRPKGFTKEWPGGKTFTYPCDYGYFPRLMGEDEEGLDAFVGDDPNGHLESFQKLKRTDNGRLVPDETKFLLGVTDAEREAIYRLYGLEVNARRVYDNVDQLGEALKRFEPKKKRAMKKTAYTARELLIASSVMGAGSGALSDPEHRWRNAAIGAVSAPALAFASVLPSDGTLNPLTAAAPFVPAAIMRAMRDRPEEKSAAYLYGVKLADITSAFTTLGRFPYAFQGQDHTEADILKAQTETPALFATQPNLKAMQMASDPYGMGMMGGMGGGMTPPVHHRHRRHHH